MARCQKARLPKFHVPSGPFLAQLAFYASASRKSAARRPHQIYSHHTRNHSITTRSSDGEATDWYGFKSSHANDSDGTPVRLNVDDEEAYQHLREDLVVDGVTRRAVTSKTRLAALYGYDSSEVDNDLVRSLATTVRPFVPCQLQISDGACFPPNPEIAKNAYHMELTFNNLYLAPCVRIICRFGQQHNRISPYLTLVVDFHFNDYCEGENNMISSYTHRNASIKFYAGRATCSGFNRIPEFASYLGAEEHKVIEVLRSFIKMGERHEITLHLDESSLAPDAVEHLDKIRTRLPDGNAKLLLPSIGQREYAAFGGKQDTVAAYDGGAGLLEPAKLMSAEAPHPMVPLQCETTFASVREAAVQLAYSAKVANEEAREALRLWSAIPHDGELFLDRGYPILAVWFRNFDRLGGRSQGRDQNLQFRLPTDLACEFVAMREEGSFAARVLDISVKTKSSTRLSGFLMAPMSGFMDEKRRVPSALFRITSHSKAELSTIFPREAQRKFSVKCVPHFSSFTYHSQLETVRELQLTKNSRWWPVLLNQNHADLELEDPTACASPAMKARAEEWLRKWKNWNPEQLAVIDSITAAKGGMTLVMGPAATGKTLLQRGIAVYFYSLGYHVAALAPANDNVNKLAKDLLEVKAELDWVDLNFNRLFPSSRDIAVDEMSEKQARYRKVGHDQGDVLPFRELLNKLEEDTKVKGAHREYGIIESVIRAADEKKLTLHKLLRSDTAIIPHFVDSWDVLRELISDYRENKIDKTDKTKLEKYRLAYRACKGQIVGLNRFMITTTGNVRSSEMREHWFNRQEDYGVPRQGVVVLVDEAAKDVEVNVWSGIVCDKWSQHVKGVFLFGDDKQLQPTNTSSKGSVQFNAFSDRLDMALPNRLEMEGFPCHRLLEQRRMHSAISAWPNRVVYGGKLRSGPGMHVSLEEQMPGLAGVLTEIIAKEIKSPVMRGKFRVSVTDDDLRRHYVEVYGRRVEHERSMAVHEHIDVFVEKILPPVFEFFRASGMKMRKEVIVICAYNYARSEYIRRIREYLKKHYPGHTSDQVPRVLSVDSSQGDEAFMVFFDASAQHGDRVGFMSSANRFNVAITRAKGVVWMIGGAMRNSKGLRSIPRPPNLMTEYKRELDAAGQSHRFEAPGKRAGG